MTRKWDKPCGRVNLAFFGWIVEALIELIVLLFSEFRRPTRSLFVIADLLERLINEPFEVIKPPLQPPSTVSVRSGDFSHLCVVFFKLINPDHHTLNWLFSLTSASTSRKPSVEAFSSEGIQVLIPDVEKFSADSISLITILLLSPKLLLI